MPLLALFLLAQAAPVAPPPRRFSILVDPCASASNDGGEVVVCGRPEALSPRLPLPQFRGPPDHPAPSNPDLKASVALDGPDGGNECGAYGEGCPVAGGGYIVPALVGGAVALAKDAFARHPDKTGRVAIPLDTPAPRADALQP